MTPGFRRPPITYAEHRLSGAKSFEVTRVLLFVAG